MPPTFVDLGMSPRCHTHFAAEQLHEMAPLYPLHAFWCDRSLLGQMQEFVSPGEIFIECQYGSSYSTGWAGRARRYAEMAIERFSLGASTRAMEIASNDSYLLLHFGADRTTALGIELAANVAKIAIERGVPTKVCFMGRETAAENAAEHGSANVCPGKSVLAHVPNINKLVGGTKRLLAPRGVNTREFQRLVPASQFDPIPHKLFSCRSWVAVERSFAHHGQALFDVEERPTHG